MIEMILNLLRQLFGRRAAAPASDCFLSDIEIPPDGDGRAVPFIASTAAAADVQVQAEGVETAIVDHSAGTGRCIVTVKQHLGVVNIRMGPRMDFKPLAQTQGGVSFDLVGASEPDESNLRWFAVRLGPRSGWVRSDLLQVPRHCLSLSYITEADVEPPPPPAHVNRFPLPASAPISQGYHSQHRAIDIATSIGVELRAPAPGTVIRRVTCTACTPQRPNVFPGPTGCPQLYSDIRWGYGYGNFFILRHDYADLPTETRAEMDRLHLTGGYAYALYAHLSQLNVALGQDVEAGQRLGLTGNHGCSSGPHLHLELRIGRDETVDGVWLQQAPLNPRFMYIL